MRCNQCDYPLWNLRDRRCPECGTEFLPSGRAYVPNSVRFCCTNCGQDYYGTDTQGHLVPRSFTCVKCGEPQTMDEMVMLPTDGVTEEQTKVFVMPWLDASYRGKPMRAWYATMGLVVSSPTRIGRAIPVGATTSRAWWFGILTIVLLLLFGHGPVTLFRVMTSLSLGIQMNLSLVGMSVAFYVVKFVAIVALIAIWGAIAHGILKISGPTSGTIGRTYQAMLYSMGAAFLTGIPAIGPNLLLPVAGIWWVVTSTIMLCVLQKVHGFRAFLASALFPTIFVVIMVGILFFFLSRVFTGAGMMNTWSSPMNTATTQSITFALTSYRIDNAVDGPPHAVGLLADDYLTMGHELMTMSTNSGWTVSLPGASNTASGPSNLSQMGSGVGMSSQQMQTIAAQAAATLPPNTIAHRLGDFVYTYHGISPTETDGSLWLVVFYPDPATNPTPAVGDTLHMGLVDGTVTSIDASTFTAALATQNAARTAAGLPQLPDPSNITTNQPALGPG